MNISGAVNATMALGIISHLNTTSQVYATSTNQTALSTPQPAKTCSPCFSQQKHLGKIRENHKQQSKKSKTRAKCQTRCSRAFEVRASKPHDSSKNSTLAPYHNQQINCTKQSEKATSASSAVTKNPETKGTTNKSASPTTKSHTRPSSRASNRPGKGKQAYWLQDDFTLQGTKPKSTQGSLHRVKRVVNGDPVPDNSPLKYSLAVVSIGNSWFTSRYCSGGVVGSNKIITAAHCFSVEEGKCEAPDKFLSVTVTVADETYKCQSISIPAPCFYSVYNDERPDLEATGRDSSTTYFNTLETPDIAICTTEKSIAGAKPFKVMSKADFNNQDVKKEDSLAPAFSKPRMLAFGKGRTGKGLTGKSCSSWMLSSVFNTAWFSSQGQHSRTNNAFPTLALSSAKDQNDPQRDYKICPGDSGGPLLNASQLS